MTTKSNKPMNSAYEPFRTNPKLNRTYIVERMYMRVLTEWSTTRFKWVNLPPTVDQRFIEQQLFYNGLVLFYEDTAVGRHLAVRGTGMGPINMYDNPTKFRTIGVSGYKPVELKPSEVVPIWGSVSRIPARDIVITYARRLADLDTSLEINAKSLRNNRIVTVEESQRLSYANILRQVDEGTPTIFGNNSMNLDAIQSLDISTNPQNLQFLRLEKNQVWNECMTLLGITNANQDKKERMVVAEANGSDGQVLAARNSAMKPREQAAEQINRLFNLNVSVEWDLDPEITAGIGEEPPEKEEKKEEGDE